MEHMNLARKGELEAEKYLSALGYQILEKNWYHRHKEIDLIAIDNDNLVVVEVKFAKRFASIGSELRPSPACGKRQTDKQASEVIYGK